MFNLIFVFIVGLFLGGLIISFCAAAKIGDMHLQMLEMQTALKKTQK